MLAALADALRLGEEDRGHLRLLAAVSSGPELCPNGRPLARQVRPSVLAMLDALDPSAAFVVNRLSDVMAWNPAFERIVGPIGMLDGDEPNLARYTFADARAASSIRRVGDVRRPASGTSCAPGHRAPIPHSTVSSPSSPPPPARRSSDGGPAYTASPKRSTLTQFAHPAVGALRLATEMLQLPDGDEQHLVVWLAADVATAAALDQLNGRYPGGLRAVAQAAS